MLGMLILSCFVLLFGAFGLFLAMRGSWGRAAAAMLIAGLLVMANCPHNVAAL